MYSYFIFSCFFIMSLDFFTLTHSFSTISLLISSSPSFNHTQNTHNVLTFSSAYLCLFYSMFTHFFLLIHLYIYFHVLLFLVFICLFQLIHNMYRIFLHRQPSPLCFAFNIIFLNEIFNENCPEYFSYSYGYAVSLFFPLEYNENITHKESNNNPYEW